MLGKIEGRRRRGHQRMRWLDSITDSIDMNLSNLLEIVEDRGAWHAAVHGFAKSRTQLSNCATTTKVKCTLSSVQSLSHVQLFVTPWTAARQASLSITNSRSPPKPMSIELVMPSNHLILCHTILLLRSVFPASRSFRLSASGGPSIGASASATVFPMNIQGWFLLDGLVGSPCSLRDSKESSPTPQFKSITSLALSLLYSPTLISIHDYWKKS